MKQTILVLLIFLWSGIVAGPVGAHLPGQPPFFKVNGKFADLYPVPGTSLADFALPQDLAPETYLVGQSIDFEIDVRALGVSEEIFNTATFSWTFGDGGTGRGGKMKHMYAKPGSYIIEIHVSSPELPTPQLFQSVLVHILPYANYTLPVAEMKVNGEIVKSASDIIYVDLKKPVKFEGAGGTTYFWDFGDATPPSQQQVVEHDYPIAKYPGGLSIVSAVLRVEDGKGFFSDKYATIYDQVLHPGNKQSDQKVATATSDGDAFLQSFKPFIVGGVVISMLVVGYFVWRKTLRRKS